MQDTTWTAPDFPDDLLTALLETEDDDLIRQLKARALAVKNAVKGEEILRRGLIEWSNRCRNDCFYCGIRRSRSGVPRYSLTPAQILTCCQQVADAGIGTFVLQGGENPAGALELVPVVRALRERWPHQAITLSLGELPFETYRLLREAGATRYLLRHETANPAHYGRKKYTAAPVLNGRKAGGVLEITSWTQENFMVMKQAERDKGPIPYFDSSTVNLGTASKGERLTAVFTCTNRGKRDLHFYKADADSPALALAEPLSDIAPAKKGSVRFTLDTSSLEKGENVIMVSLTTNSPLRPLVNVFVAVVLR